MFRLVFVAFLGAPKSEAAGHAQESPPVMVWPLRILAVLSIIGGFIGIEQLYGGNSPPSTLSRTAPFSGSYSLRSSTRRSRRTFGLLAVLVGFARRLGALREGGQGPVAGEAGRAVARDAEPLLLRRALPGDGHPLARFPGGGGRLVRPLDHRRPRRARDARHHRAGGPRACACSRPATCRPTPSCSPSAWRWCFISCLK